MHEPFHVPSITAPDRRSAPSNPVSRAYHDLIHFKACWCNGMQSLHIRSSASVTGRYARRLSTCCYKEKSRQMMPWGVSKQACHCKLSTMTALCGGHSRISCRQAASETEGLVESWTESKSLIWYKRHLHATLYHVASRTIFQAHFISRWPEQDLSLSLGIPISQTKTLAAPFSVS